MDVLTFEHGHRKGETFLNGTSRADRMYIDFIVSGRSLRDLLQISKYDLIGALGWSKNKPYEYKRIDEFLGIEKPELETGRTCFYVCPECGDIGCGAVTGKIEVTGQNVIWKDFGYENNYSEPVLDKYKDIGPFSFHISQYFTLFTELKLR